MFFDKSRIESIIGFFVTAHPYETSCLIYSTCSFFFILGAYFAVLPLRDEGAISLGLGNLPGLFVGSLFLTLVAAPVSTLVFSSPNLSKEKALVFILRFFSLSLVVFFILWIFSTPGSASFNVKGIHTVNSTTREELKVSDAVKQTGPSAAGWGDHGWFYVAVRISMFLWVALLNLITISSTWARVIDVMDSESGSRLFGFIGAGATLGQLFGSVFATGMAWLGPYLLLFAALLLEFAAQSSKGIKKDISSSPEELLPFREADSDRIGEANKQGEAELKSLSPRKSTSQIWSMFEGLQLILSSSYLLQVALFLWLSALVSSFFYFQKVTIIASTVTSPIGRRRLFAQINSFIALFILAGQLTLTGRILTRAGVTRAICTAPVVAFANLIALSVWPSWICVAISETLRKVVMYVVTRPARELLFTVVTQDEKYKAKVCIDIIVQRVGDATAAGIFKLFFTKFSASASIVSLFALPLCLLWIITAYRLGHLRTQLAAGSRQQQQM